MANEQIGNEASGQKAAPEGTAGPLGESSSEMYGAREVELARADAGEAAGRGEPGRSDLGGTSSHQRSSFSDPLPETASHRRDASDRDEATGRRTPGPGSPEWMREPVDQTVADLRDGALRSSAAEASDRARPRGPDGAMRPPDESRR